MQTTEINFRLIEASSKAAREHDLTETYVLDLALGSQKAQLRLGYRRISGQMNHNEKPNHTGKSIWARMKECSRGGTLLRCMTAWWDYVILI